ncbi:MAG: type II toxin-antitoxin system Phd/YefM family antitoxin [Clostridiales bacterium]|jgi:PHD/YefM family antitoxin component YafN of YafNO toxin-antitoxin module|nr:type II toxin-antitoxin system Phd/YefM family antitoxin [Clostridiales bacterium]
MPQIMPIKDLKDTTKICEKIKKSNEPIFITKNGYGEMVIMNMKTYDEFFAITEIRKKLKEAEDEIANGAELLDGFQVLDELEKEIGV